MNKKILIVGGVAGGASAAARARRLSEHAEIIVFEKDHYISFANCGLPYHIGGVIPDRDDLLLQTPESMKARFNLDIRVRSEVIAVDATNKCVSIRKLESGQEYSESYDELILSPGARAFIPPIPGIDHSRVFSLRNIADMDNIIGCINRTSPTSAVVLGGGFIGIETAEALVERGIQTTLVEKANQIMAPFDAEMAVPLHQTLRHHNIELKLSLALESLTQNGKGELCLTLSDGSQITTDFVIAAIGVRPDTRLAQAAGLRIGNRGGIAVDSHMRTSEPHIWAVGDAIEVIDFVSGEPALVPLAGPANRQGRIVADNIFGRESEYNRTQGTAICKIFDYTAAATGNNEKLLQHHKIAYQKIYVHGGDHASYYPGAERISLKLLFDPETGRLLGAQALGKAGVDKRIDVLATMLRAGQTVFDMEEAELAYAPPFGSARDIINQAGFVASNVIRGDLEICHANAVFNPTKDTLLLDVRDPEELDQTGSIPGAINIPLNQLREQLYMLPKDKTIIVFCAVGLRGYVAYRLLHQLGYSVKNVSGGYSTCLMVKHMGV